MVAHLCTVPVVLAVSATIMFWLFLLTLVVPKRWGLARAGDVLFGASMSCLLVAIITSVVATLAISVLRMAT